MQLAAVGQYTSRLLLATRVSALLMDHWIRHFTNRPLPRPLFVSVRWARLTELWASYCVRQAFSRIGFLHAIEVDFERIDYEQGRWYQTLVDAPRTRYLSLPQPRSVPPAGLVPAAVDSGRGIWV